MGILEDVPIKLEDLHVLIDFVILKMKESTRTLIILGRPFLATAGAILMSKMVNYLLMWKINMWNLT